MLKVSKEQVLQKVSDILDLMNDLNPNFVEIALTTDPEEQSEFKLYDFDTAEKEFSKTLEAEYPDGDIELSLLIVNLLESDEDPYGEEIASYEFLEEDFI